MRDKETFRVMEFDDDSENTLAASMSLESAILFIKAYTAEYSFYRLILERE